MANKDTYPNPCESCEKEPNCGNTKCDAWRIRYLYRQKQINAYAEKVLPAYYASLKKEGAENGQ